MRLHLPKGLLAALLAACFALPAGAEGETTTQYGWKDGAPATSKDGTTWTNITYDGKILSSTDAPISLPSGDVKLMDFPSGEWGLNTTANPGGVSVTGTADSAWFSPTGSKRIYMSGDNINKMSNIFLTGVHFVVGTSSTASEIHTIASNLFLGAGAWANDSGSVHYKAVLRANVDANISGNVTLTDSSAHISTWDGKDITFAGSLNGNGKSLSVGAESVNSVIHLNGTTNLGSLTVGAGVDTDGALSAKGAAISVVIGASAAAEIGNLTLLSGSTLTNNGQLTISGSYYGGAITQGNGGELILSKGMSLNMDGMTALFGSQKNDEQSGFQSYDATYTLVQGGSVTDNGAKFKVGGESFTGSCTVGDDGVCKFSCTESRYNLLSGEETSIQNVETAAGSTSAYFIEVSGVLTGVSDGTLTHGIRGTGNIRIGKGDQLSYSTLSDKGAGFTGTLQLNGGSIKMDEEVGRLSNAISVLSDSSLKLDGMMSVVGNVTATQGKTLSISLAEDATSGELLFLGTVGKLDGATLQIEDGVTVSVSGRSGGNAQIAGAIVVNGGGTLKLTSQDTLGYGGDGGNFTDSITLQGTADKTATLNLAATQTLTTSLILKGNTSITGEAMNSFDGSITATGTNNIISNELKIRKNLTITVGNSADPTGSLEIADKLGVFDGFSGVLTKNGGGTLIVSGTGHAYTRAVTVNDGTLELRSAFNPVKIDLRGTDTTSGSLVIAAGGTGTVNLGSGDGNGLWMDADSTVSIRKAESETTRGGKLIFGTSTSGATISATDADADASISSSTTGQYIFSSADFSLSNAEFLFNSTGQWGASLGNSLTNVSVINKSNNLLLTVTHEGNTLRGVEATGGNIKFAANAEVTGSIKIADGKSVVVNSGAALTHDGFTYDGSTIKTSNAGSALSLWQSSTVVR